MKLCYRILTGVAAISMVAAAALAIAISHDAPCPGRAPATQGLQQMKAVLYRCYGSPDVLKVEDTARPLVADDQVLVKVRAAAINPLDWHFMRGEPYFMRLSSGLGAPADPRIGVDFAGTVESVGKHVTRFKPGDEVLGGSDGALAEFTTVREHGAIVMKPANLTFEQAASVGVAGITALQALRDHGKIQPGQKVLINGASGGVGTFAVQIARSLGAEVTGVCSTRNVELVRALGADHVIDYTQTDFTQATAKYDLIIDNVGNHSFAQYRRALQPSGTLMIVGGPSSDPWLGPLIGPLKASLSAPFVTQRFVMILARLNEVDLQVLAGLMESGRVTPVIDRTFPFNDVPAAIAYLEAGRARGKVVITISP